MGLPDNQPKWRVGHLERSTPPHPRTSPGSEGIFTRTLALLLTPCRLYFC